jgi:hypothetical protein
MKPFCTHCQSADHWTNQCPQLNPSHGTPRVETRPLAPPPPPRRTPLVPQIIAPEHIRRPARQPVTTTVTLKPVTETANVTEKSPVTKKARGRPRSPAAKSAAERARAYRARLRAAKSKKEDPSKKQGGPCSGKET